MAIKKSFGKIIGQVEGLKIRQIDKTSTVKGKLVTVGTTIGIYQSKNMVESGFKNKEVALTRAKELKSVK